MLSALALYLVRFGAWLLAKRAGGVVVVELHFYDLPLDGTPGALTLHKAYGA